MTVGGPLGFGIGCAKSWSFFHSAVSQLQLSDAHTPMGQVWRWQSEHNINTTSLLAQLVERETVNLEVVSSILTRRVLANQMGPETQFNSQLW